MAERESAGGSAATARFAHVIVGASAAGLAALEAIRETESRQQLVPSSLAVISEEPYPPYGRHLISYYLTGERQGELLGYRPANYFSRQHAQAWLGWRAVGIDPTRHTVTLERVAEPLPLPGGEPQTGARLTAGVVGVDPALPAPASPRVEIGYERLLLAGGGEPIRPRLEDPAASLAAAAAPEGAAAAATGVYTFTTLADAVRLRQALDTGRIHQVVVVGGGLIGLQVAEALTRLPAALRPAQITIVELLPRLLAPVLDEEGSQRVQTLAEAAGVAVLTGKAAAALRRDPEGHLTGLQLASGEVLPAQAVILAVGVRPRLELARQAGLACGRGITLHNGAQTSDPFIYAAGDGAEGWDLAAEQQRPLPVWSNAAWQGHWAGRQMAGAITADDPPHPVPGLMLNAAHFFGLAVVSGGVHQPPREHEGKYAVLAWSRALAVPKVPPQGSIQLSRNGRPLPDRSSTAARLAAGGWDYRKLVLHEGRLVGMMAAGPSVAGAGFISGLIRQRVSAADFGQALLERWDVTALPRRLRQQWLWGEMGQDDGTPSVSLPVAVGAGSRAGRGEGRQ